MNERGINRGRTKRKKAVRRSEMKRKQKKEIEEKTGDGVAKEEENDRKRHQEG